MEAIIGLVIVGAIVVAVLAALKKKQHEGGAAYSYIKKSELLSPAERSFFGALVLAVADNGTVLPKIRVADVLTPKKGSDKSTWQRAFNRISAKHFDFVVCEASSLTPLVAVELDDSSHSNKSASQRDSAKDAACQSAGFPLVRVKAARSYAVAEIQQLLAQHFPSAVAEPAISSTDSSVSEAAGIFNPSITTEAPPCPKCNSSMVLRETKKGNNAGKKFWGCSQFPDCRGILQADT
jgi:Zn-finger domain associated with topoisomerase type I